MTEMRGRTEGLLRHRRPVYLRHAVKARCPLIVTFVLLSAPMGEASGSAAEIDPPLPFAFQEAASEGAEDDVDTVVVSAKRRGRSLMDVPFSTTILSQRELRDVGVQTLSDLPSLVPGMVFSSDAILGEPYLRGVGSGLLTSGAESSVATYVDEVYRTRPVASNVSLYDIDHVEVIAGPQGTLFGRNATGGVLQVVTKRPQAELGGEATLLYGNYDEVRLTGAVNVPVADGGIRVRLSGLGDWRDGYTENLYTSRSVDDLNVGAGRAQTEIDLGTSFVLRLSGDYLRERDSRAQVQKLVPPLEASPAVALFGGTVPSDPREVLMDTSPLGTVERWGLLGRLDGSLGELDVVSLTAYRATRFSETLDLDATQVPLLVNEPTESSGTFTQELRLTSEWGDFSWLAGLYYLHEDATNDQVITSPLGGFEDVTHAQLTSDSVAGFADVAWDLADSWRASVGLRVSWDRRTEEFHEAVTGVPVAAFDETADWVEPTPRAGLEWRPGTSALAYGSVSRGYKAGGFNSLVAQPFPFDPEFLWAYELGVKATLLDDCLRLRAAGFYYDWQDMQLLLVEPEIAPLFPVVVNAASASILGLDWAMDYTPVEALRMSVSLSLLDARFDDFVAVDPNHPDEDPNRSGERLPRAPAVALHASAQYAFDLHRLGMLTPRADVQYQSRIYFFPFEDPLVSQPGFGLLNLLLRWDDPDSRFFASVFVHNVTNQLWTQFGVRVDGQIGNQALYASPRRYGFQVGARL